MSQEKLDGAKRSFMTKRLVLLVAALLLSPLMLIAGLYLAGGYVKITGTWWYPFVPSLLSDYYVTGPFAIPRNSSSNVLYGQSLTGRIHAACNFGCRHTVVMVTISTVTRSRRNRKRAHRHQHRYNLR